MKSLRLPVLLPVLAATLLVACGGGSGGGGEPAPAPEPRPAYPATKTTDEASTHFGQRVADPYRWLEDTRSTATIDWVRAQNAFSASLVEGQPMYARVLERLEQLRRPQVETSGQAKTGAAGGGRVDGVQQVGQQRQGLYYYQWSRGQVQRSGLQHRPDGRRAAQQAGSVDNRIYVATAAGQAGQVLLDVGQVAREAADDVIQLLDHRVSEDGRFLVYRLQRNHADLTELHLFDLRTPGRPLVRLSHAASGSFLLEGNALVFVEVQGVQEPGRSSYARQNLMQVTLDDSLPAPRPLYEGQPGEMLGLGPVIGGWLYFDRAAHTNASDLLRLRLERPAEIATVLDGAGRTSFGLLQQEEDTGRLLVQTSDASAFNRVVSIDPEQPARGQWRHVLPARPGDVVLEVQACGRYAYATQWAEGAYALVRYAIDGASAPRDIALPSRGAVLDVECGKADGEQDDITYMHSTLVQPGQKFAYQASSDTVVRLGGYRYPGHDPQRYEVRQLLVPGSDGVSIPITLAHRKGLPMDGSAPALINVYGGFLTPMPAYFDDEMLPLLEAGGVYVVAHVRGGGEQGTAWYDAGRLFNKQRTYEDVADVARHLAAQRYTSAARLGVSGWSNGGTTSAAVALRNPELLAVALPHVGVHDLTRYVDLTWGFSWTGDYGDPRVEPEFAHLMTFSPLHNVRARNYPAIYVMTGQNDVRVSPGHSYKLAATLQNTATGKGPYLLHSFAKSGHGIESERTRVAAHALTFLFTHTGTAY